MSNNQYTPKRKPIQITPTIAGIVLTKGEIALVDACYASYLTQWNWSANIKHKDAIIYAVRYDRYAHPKLIQIHRIIKSLELERSLLTTEHIDHIDGDGRNNILTNLRLATPSNNMWNQRLNKNNTSGFKGVSLDKRSNKWLVSIQAHGKQIHIRGFLSPEEAYVKYCEMAKELHGEFFNAGLKRLNIPK